MAVPSTSLHVSSSSQLLLLLLLLLLPSPMLVSARLPSFPRPATATAAASPPNVRAVSLGGWLVIEGWIKPSLFDGIPDNDLLDGARIQLRSVTLGTYVSADGGGGGVVAVNRQNASTWETFKTWRVEDGSYQLRVLGNEFMSAEGGGGGIVSANRTVPSTWETFQIIRSPTDKYRVHIRVYNGMYMQAVNPNQLTADYAGDPAWDDNPATFEMTITSFSLHGDFQLANGYGPVRAATVYEEHRKTFVTENDFSFLSSNGINAVRIPIGWWIASDPNPPPPYISGSLQALDNAFMWARKHNIKIIVDLHAAPGSQNGMEHSSSRDGSADWALPGTNYIAQTLSVIDFIASRYAANPVLLGIELLNEPVPSAVSLDVLSKYYIQGYHIVRNYSSSAFVIMCAPLYIDPHEIAGLSNGLSNVVLDLHYYNLFASLFANMTAQQNIDYINQNRLPQILSLNSANGFLTFVGEWVNEWDVSNATLSEYQTYGNVQLEAYAKATFGWSYWTLRNFEKHWDFEWNVEDKYLLQNSNGGWPSS